MKKSLVLLAIISSTVNAEVITWKFKKDYVLDGVITSPVTSNLDIEMLSNIFIGNVSVSQSPNIIQGVLEDKNNINVGSGTTERINFTISELELKTYFLGQSNLNGGYFGTWYGPNNESGDFTITTEEEPQAAGPLIPTLSSNTSYSPIVVSASSAHWHSDLAPWKAFNDDFSHWSTAQCFEGTSGWLQVDFGVNKNVSSYKIRGRDDSLTSTYKDWEFQGSSDGSSWVTIHSPSSQTNWSLGEEREFNFTPVNYRYYRWDVASYNGNPDNIACVQELQIEGF